MKYYLDYYSNNNKFIQSFGLNETWSKTLRDFKAKELRNTICKLGILIPKTK